MNIRKATNNDLDMIMLIVNQAKAYLKSQNIDQWQDGYPNEEVFSNDIKNDSLYVVVEKDEVIGVYCVLDYEVTYNQIDGKWLNDEPYIVIHRIAIRNDYKGQNVAGFIFNELHRTNKNIRIDTHKENKSMINCLLKNDFKYCGVITLLSKAKRNAYQLI